MVRPVWNAGQWVAENWYLILSALGLGILLVTEKAFFYNQHPHWQTFLKEFAFALIISSIFGATIEKYQREEFVKLVNSEREGLKQDIFLYAYGHAIPEQIRDEIRESILKAPCYREHLRIEWEFSEIPENAELLKVEKKYTYVLKNNTPQVQKYPFRFVQITASEKEALTETKFECLKVREEGKTQEFNQAGMNQERPPGEPHTHKFFKDLEVQAGKSLEIYYAVTERRRRYADDMYGPSQPVVGRTTVIMRVQHPLKLELSASCKAKTLASGPDHDPPRRYSWYLDEGLIPFQGIAVSWSPILEDKQNPPAEDPA
jgi:hypothetical protein